MSRSTAGWIKRATHTTYLSRCLTSSIDCRKVQQIAPTAVFQPQRDLRAGKLPSM